MRGETYDGDGLGLELWEGGVSRGGGGGGEEEGTHGSSSDEGREDSEGKREGETHCGGLWWTGGCAGGLSERGTFMTVLYGGAGARGRAESKCDQWIVRSSRLRLRPHVRPLACARQTETGARQC